MGIQGREVVKDNVIAWPVWLIKMLLKFRCYKSILDVNMISEFNLGLDRFSPESQNK